LCHICAIPRQE